MMRIIAVCIFSSVMAQAYIPSAQMIIDRVVENSFKTPLYVEQEVVLTLQDQTVTVKEQWLFESENSIRLIVRGEKDLKEQISFQAVYSETQKTTSISGLLQTEKQAHPLFEKMFFIKSTDNFYKFLIQLGVVSEEIFKSQNFKKLPGNSGFQYQPEPFLRLGRIGGGVAYIFGPQPKGEAQTPGFWVEQDIFNILKLRNHVGDEISIERPTTFSRGAKWPKEASFVWKSNQGIAQAQVQAHSVKIADASLKQSFQKSADRRTPEFERNTAKYLLEEFYQRFR